MFKFRFGPVWDKPDDPQPNPNPEPNPDPPENPEPNPNPPPNPSENEDDDKWQKILTRLETLEAKLTAAETAAADKPNSEALQTRVTELEATIASLKTELETARKTPTLKPPKRPAPGAGDPPKTVPPKDQGLRHREPRRKLDRL